MTIEYISRNEWGAGDHRSGYAVPHENFTRLVIHHTVSVIQDYDRDGFLHGDRDDVIRYMQKLQVARPDLGNEVPYSFVVFRGADELSAIVAEGRGWGWKGAHTAEMDLNRRAYGIALAGDFTHEAPSKGMLAAIRWLGSQLHDPLNAKPTLGHRDTKATQCPGNSAYPLLDRLQPPFQPTYEYLEDDMLTPDQARRLAAMPAQVMVQPAKGHVLEGSWWLAYGPTKSWVPNGDLYAKLTFLGVLAQDNGHPVVLDHDWFDMLVPVHINYADPRHVEYSSHPRYGGGVIQAIANVDVKAIQTAIDDSIRKMRFGAVQ